MDTMNLQTMSSSRESPLETNLERYCENSRPRIGRKRLLEDPGDWQGRAGEPVGRECWSCERSERR